MMFRTLIAIGLALLLLTLSGGEVVCAQSTREKVKDQVFADSLGVKAFTKSQIASNDFYDRILASKSGFVRWVGNLLIGARSSADDAAPIPETQINREYFELFQGRKITSIIIRQANIFGQSEDDDLSWTERALDNMHVRTRESVVQKNLLFHIGDTIDPYRMAVNEQLLRNKPYFATAFFVILPDRDNPQGVEVRVFTRDNWTISASGAWGSAPYLDVFDRNFIGSGNMLLLRYYMQRNDQDHGLELDYSVNNILGTFANATFRAGVGSTNNVLEAVVQKDFLTPSDHLWGLRAGYVTENRGLMTMDTTVTVSYQNYSAFYGYSWNVDKRMGTGIYAIAAANYLYFDQVPDRTAWLNPAYTDRLQAMMNIGISRQNFFQGNMIYGYGRLEDVPYGFKAELSAGYELNEQIGHRWWVGAEARWGYLTKIGYLDLGVSGGSYLTPEGKPQQVLWRASVNYFSPLWHLGDMYVRQFLALRYTQGLYRLAGERERLGMDNVGIRGMSTPLMALGTNRLMINTETVFFTPIFLYHFRFAFYGWFDCGWLGMNDNVFSNPFGGAIGLGVRIKNERLIFNNIQLRFGVSLQRLPGAGYNWFQLSNENSLRVTPFTPTPPAPYEYE